MENFQNIMDGMSFSRQNKPETGLFTIVHFHLLLLVISLVLSVISYISYVIFNF